MCRSPVPASGSARRVPITTMVNPWFFTDQNILARPASSAAAVLCPVTKQWRWLEGGGRETPRKESELVHLVERMEQERKDAAAAHKARHVSDAEALSLKRASIVALQQHLTDAVRGRVSQARTGRPGGQLDAIRRLAQQAPRRVARPERRPCAGAPRAARETVRALRVDKGGLEARMADGRVKAKEPTDVMKQAPQRILRISQEFLVSPKRAVAHDRGDRGEDFSSPVGFVARPAGSSQGWHGDRARK